MDVETARYIIRYFPNLLTYKEALALQHSTHSFRLGPNPNKKKLEFFEKHGWITNDSEALELLKDGREQFGLNAAERILRQSRDKVFFNTCPGCMSLALTPAARQCKYCHRDWHHINVAQFKLLYSTEISGTSYFYLAVKITKGKAQIGNYVDLTMLGFSCRPQIKDIQVLKGVGIENEEQLYLGTDDIEEEDKQNLKRFTSSIPLDIINETF